MQFPPDFLWGAATAAYQIEGAVSEDGRGRSIWDVFAHTPGKTLNGDTGDKATDHYHRLDEDLDLMRDLGLRAYRFSVSWPRVLPDGAGRVNECGLDFYRRLVDGLLDRGITPAMTLYHWDLPQALQDLGGWASRETSARFAEYADVVALALGDRVPIWITVNEPWISSWFGYGLGIHAPGIADLGAAAAAHHHLLLGHGLATAALRSRLGRDRQVGAALSLAQIYPASDHPDDVAAAGIVDRQFNRSCLDPIFKARYPEGLGRFSDVWSDDAGPVRPGDLDTISAPLDFLGVNSYFSRIVASPGRLVQARANGLLGRFDPAMAFGMQVADVLPEGIAVTAFGWPVQPSGLRDLLVSLHGDLHVPIYVTENGAAYDDYASPEGRVLDMDRVAYLDGHLRAVHEALGRGADVRGYFVWSLIDNFEWAAGYSKRFGIVYVDFPSSRRTPKASFAWYRDVIAANAIRATEPSGDAAP